MHTRKTSNGSNFGWLIRQMSINQKSGRQTFRRRFVSGSLFVSPCPPECYLQSETKVEPDLRLGQHPVFNGLVKGSFQQSHHSLELSSPPRRTTQVELPLDPLVGEEILELLISHYLLDPFDCIDKFSRYRNTPFGVFPSGQ